MRPPQTFNHIVKLLVSFSSSFAEELSPTESSTNNTKTNKLKKCCLELLQAITAVAPPCWCLMSQCGKNHPRDLGAFLLGWFHLSRRASASLITPPMVPAQGWVNNIPVERVWSLPAILCFGMDPTIHYIQGVFFLTGPPLNLLSLGP